MEGEGRALASDTLAGLQDIDPKLRGSIPGSWRLLRTWVHNEIPARAPPFPELILKAMAGFAIFHQQEDMALSLLLGFYGLLRTGELLGIQNKHVAMTSPSKVAVISLGLTKSGKRVGASESITIGVLEVLQLLWAWKCRTPASAFLCPSPCKWRSAFSHIVSQLQLSDWQFRPYSLRRGGATMWFQRHSSFDKLLVQGRWSAARTARIYLNDSLATLAEMKIPKKHLRPYLTVYRSKTRQ